MYYSMKLPLLCFSSTCHCNIKTFWNSAFKTAVGFHFLHCVHHLFSTGKPTTPLETIKSSHGAIIFSKTKNHRDLLWQSFRGPSDKWNLDFPSGPTWNNKIIFLLRIVYSPITHNRQPLNCSRELKLTFTVLCSYLFSASATSKYHWPQRSTAA